MDIYSVRQQLRSASIYDLALRVAFYARVSTDSDEQKNSLENQTNYYTDLINNTNGWIYAGGYIDEGLSGASVKKRENFNIMIEDAKAGKFDLIITKEISRFARNTLDSIKFTRELLSYGVCVFFQNDNINTVDEDAELRLTIMASLAQDELRKLSSRVKFGHQQSIKKGVVLGNNRIFGYDYVGGKLVINQSEAEMIKTIFTLYATGEYSTKQICRILWAQGYKNHNDDMIKHTTISGILKNPKYKGYYVGNKVRIVDLFTKRQKFLPEDQWVMYKDETGEKVPAIVSEEVWDKANEILARKSKDVKNRQNKCNHANLLTGKLFCTHCGVPYYRKASTHLGEKCSTWRCSGKIKNGKDSCPSLSLFEDEIKRIIFDLFVDTHEDVEECIDKQLELLKSVVQTDETPKMNECAKIIQAAKAKKMKLLDLVASGVISESDFSEMNDACTKEIDDAQAVIDEIQNREQTQLKAQQEMAQFKRKLMSAVEQIKNSPDIPMEFIQQYINRIDVTFEGHTIKLEFHLFSGEAIQKSFYCSRSHLTPIGNDENCSENQAVLAENSHVSKSRTGNMSNNMCTEGQMVHKFTRPSRNDPGYSISVTYISSVSFF